MPGIRVLVSLARVRQYYKNLLVFLPLLFGQHLNNVHALLLTCIAFVCLCLASSATYVINDLADQKEDRKHPEKRLRPIAAGKISASAAIVLASLLVLCSLGIAVFLSHQFFWFVLALLVLSQLYTFWLRQEAFADILLIATNFVLRAVSGAYVIAVGTSPYISVSPWLILCPFFLSLFLSVAKRESDLAVRKVTGIYTKETTNTMMIIATTLLIVSYSLYSFLSVNPHLLYTLPFALYVIFRYLHLVESGSPIARNPELAYKDIRLMIGVSLWLASALVILYT